MHTTCNARVPVSFAFLWWSGWEEDQHRYTQENDRQADRLTTETERKTERGTEKRTQGPRQAERTQGLHLEAGHSFRAPFTTTGNPEANLVMPWKFPNQAHIFCPAQDPHPRNRDREREGETAKTTYAATPALRTMKRRSMVWAA